MDALKRVVVTGIGLVTPLGCDLEEVWRRLTAGESGVAEITRFDHRDQRVHFAAEVKDFDAGEFIDKRAARRMDLNARFAVVAARVAEADAVLEVGAEPEAVGAVVGSGVGGIATLEAEVGVLAAKGADRVNPLLVPMMIPNMAAAQISLELGTKGPLNATCTACAAGSNAVGDAFEIIRRGSARAMFAGGAEAPICPISVSGFAAARALSTRNDDPTHASRPFDKARDGFVMGEGAGVLLLEEFEHARARGTRIYAEIVGYGLSADAHHMTAPDDSGIPQGRAILGACAEAGVDPGEIDYINAHGTSTVPGDIAETRAIRYALGAHADAVAVSSTKSMIGHCLGASGAIEAAFAVLAIDRGVIPPTTNLTDPDPECDLDYVPLAARETEVNVAASNSFGFGGHNVTLLFRRFV